MKYNSIVKPQNKITIKIFYCLLTIYLLSCNQNPTEKKNEEIKSDKIKEKPIPQKQVLKMKEPYTSKCSFIKDSKNTLQNTFPFNKATKIEAISFDNSVKEWDSIREKFAKIENNRLILPGVKKKTILDKKQTQNLFEILILNQGNRSDQADCYNPAHILVFYEQAKPICFLEICFSCRRVKSYKTQIGDFCDEKWIKLKSFFAVIGVL